MVSARLSALTGLSFASLASRNEVNPLEWHQRFAALLESGLLRLCAWPGRELSLAVGRFPCGDSITRLVSFCYERFSEAHENDCLLNIDLSRVSPADSLDWVREFEQQLADAFAADVPVCFSVTDEHPDLEAVIRLRNSDLLATASVAVRYGECLDGSDRNTDRGEMLAEQSHADARLKLVPHRSLRPISGFHSRERGDCVMPAGLFEAGTDTAWLMLEVDAARLANARYPRRKLSECLRFADNLIDVIDWPRPVLQLDALLNRRVCLHVTGIGDLLTERGMHPRCADTFLWLKRWLSFVSRSLLRESRVLANDRGPFPQLGTSELIAELAPRYGVENAKQIVRNSCLRHRHVLALSPFALFPSKTSVVPADLWINLIPALQCADALTMYGPDSRQRLSQFSWHRLLQLTGALARAHQAVSKFA